MASMKEARRSYGSEDEPYITRRVSGTNSGRNDAGRAESASSNDENSQDRNGVTDLQRVVEGEIIPRLMLIQSSGQERRERHRAAASHKQLPSITLEHVAEFSELVLEHDMEIATLYIDGLCEQGVSIDKLFAELLAPTARCLGVWWESDQIDFVAVTVGMSMLHEIVHRYRPNGIAHVDQAKRILLRPAPGEQHTFGLLLVSDYFSNRGWDVRGGYFIDPPEIDSLIGSERWNVLGFSIANVRLAGSLTREIERARKLSRNTDVQILVGGNAIASNPELAEELGADLAASSPAEAFAICEAACSRGRATLN